MCIRDRLCFIIQHCGSKSMPQHVRTVSYTHLMDCTGEITLPEGTEMVMPGDNVTITVELIYPVALNPGLRLSLIHIYSG